MVGEVGVEPTQLESNGFTDRSSSPTLALPYIYYSYIGTGRVCLTHDLLIKSQLLYLLSYTRIWSWWTDLNPRPTDYKSATLPTELHQHMELTQRLEL